MEIQIIWPKDIHPKDKSFLTAIIDSYIFDPKNKNLVEAITKASILAQHILGKRFRLTVDEDFPHIIVERLPLV